MFVIYNIENGKIRSIWRPMTGYIPKVADIWRKESESVVRYSDESVPDMEDTKIIEECIVHIETRALMKGSDILLEEEKEKSTEEEFISA